MLLVTIYPLLFLFLVGQSFSSRNKSSEGNQNLSFVHHLLFLTLLLIPWLVTVATIVEGEFPDITINTSPLTRNADLWLLTVQGVYAAVFLSLRNLVKSQEAWFKSSISALLGLMFLQVSLHPSVGLFFSISTDWAQIISATSFIIALFLLYHLPPLQLGGVDSSEDSHLPQQTYLNVGLKMTLTYIILFTLTFANWLSGLEGLIPLITGALLIGLSLSRLVLRLQTNVFRTLAYVSSGFSLSIVIKLIFPDFGDITFLFQFLFLMPLYIFLAEGSRSSSLRNWAGFRQENSKAARRFQIALYVFLYSECAVCLGLMAGLIMQGHWVLSICAAIAAFSTLVVNLDRQAFAPHALV
ncbi:MAG: hypothetical protein EOP07_02600 [Proteobacteria bacterium]|nr:MAG: hypothetical protein EOP07_02600 [Pseudomonadota bacterium]